MSPPAEPPRADPSPGGRVNPRVGAPAGDPGRGTPPATHPRATPGPGPGLLLAAVGLLLVGLGSRGAPPVVGLPLGLPRASPLALAGVGTVLAVLLVAALAPRLRDASRVLLTSTSLAALGVALSVLGPADGAPGARAPAAGAALLGLPDAGTDAVVAVLAVVALELAVVAVAGRYGVRGRRAAAAGALAGLVALLGAGVGSGVTLPVLAAALGAVLLAACALRGTTAAAATPSRQGGPRRDLLPAAVLCAAALVVTLLAALPGAVLAAPPAVAGVLGALAVAAVGERLARRGAAGHLEVLARALVGTLVVGLAVLLVPAVVAGTGPAPRSGRLAVTAVAVAGLVVAALLPAPPPPAYTRSTHLRVLRGLPWALVAVLVGVGALALPVPSRPGPPAAAAPGTPTGATSDPSSAPSGPPGPAGGAGPGASSLSVTSIPAAPSKGGPSMRIGTVTGTSVEVVIRSPRATDPLEVRTRIGADEISYPLLRITPDTNRVVVVSLPEHGRFLVTLHDMTSTTALQTLVVER